MCLCPTLWASITKNSLLWHCLEGELALSLRGTGNSSCLVIQGALPLCWGERKHSYEDGRCHCILILQLWDTSSLPTHSTGCFLEFSSWQVCSSLLGRPLAGFLHFSTKSLTQSEKPEKAHEICSLVTCVWYLMSGAYSLFSPRLGSGCHSALWDTF